MAKQKIKDWNLLLELIQKDVKNAEIARIFKVSRERIRQLKNKVKKQLSTH